MRFTFNQKGTFQALYAAERWLKAKGYSLGQGCAGQPSGILKGDFNISKWRNLSKEQIARLDGRLTGDMREGPVHVDLKLPIVVASAREKKLSERPGTHVYIGRQMPGREASPLGNPFKLEREAERLTCLDQYHRYLRDLLSQKPDTLQRQEVERLARIAMEGPLVLICWCAPKRCHGDIVAHYINDFAARIFDPEFADVVYNSPALADSVEA